MEHMDQEILIALGRLEGKVESLISMQRSHDEEITTLDKRVRTLEQGKAAIWGGAAVIGSISAAIISFFFKDTI
jgi:hypothetical protein